MTDKKAEAIVDILAKTLAEIKPKTLSEKLTNVKAAKRDEMRYLAICKPSQRSDAGGNATIRDQSS